MFKTLTNERKKFTKWRFVMHFLKQKLDDDLPTWPDENEWKVQQHLLRITDERLQKQDGSQIDLGKYSVAYIYNLLKK